MPALPPLPASLGRQVTTRDFNLLEMVARAWGGEFSAPDHRVYCFGGGVRCFDSTDLGTTGIYQRGVSTATAPVLSGSVIANTYVNLGWSQSTIVGSDIVSYALYRSVNSGPFALLIRVPFTVFQYQDFAISVGNTYQYYVIGEPQAPGNDSPASNTVTETISNPGNNFVITAGASGPPPTCPCPCAPAHFAGFIGANVSGGPMGSVTPSSLSGQQIGAIVWQGLLGEAFSLVQVIIYGTLAHNFFASLVINDGDTGPVTYNTSASTNYGQTTDGLGATVTFWQWSAGYMTPPMSGGGTYHVTIT